MKTFVCVGLVLLSSTVHSLFPPSGPYQVDRGFSSHIRESTPAFNTLGSSLASSAHCLSRDGDIVHCFYTTPEGTVGYASIKDGGATFEDFGGSVVHQPQTVGYDKGGVFAHFVAPDGHLVVSAVETGTEFDKKVTVLPFGTFLEAPGCTMLKSNVDVFCVIRSTNGDMSSFRFTDGAWSHPRRVTDNPTCPMTCVYNAVAGSVHCWGANQDNILAERLFTGEGLPMLPFWLTQYHRVRGRVLVKMLGVVPLPRALSYSSNQMVDIWGEYGGELSSEPDCASADARSLDCFALDSDNGIQRNYQRVGPLYTRKTSGWLHYGGAFVGKPSCLYLDSDQKLHCYLRRETDELVDVAFKSFNSPRVVV